MDGAPHRGGEGGGGLRGLLWTVGAEQSCRPPGLQLLALAKHWRRCHSRTPAPSWDCTCPTASKNPPQAVLPKPCQGDAEELSQLTEHV